MRIEVEMSLVIFFNVLVYGLGYLFIIYKGFKKNIIFAFSWGIFTIYYFITPTYFYFIGRNNIWGDEIGYQGTGENISDFYDEGLLYYGLANLLFLLGFFFITKAKKHTEKIEFNDRKLVLLVIFAICFCLVLLNFGLTGFNLLDFVNGNSEETLFGATGASNYLKNFSDSIITCLILMFALKINWRIIFVIYLLSFILFGLMGFRYRIMMTVMGILIILLYRYQFNFKDIVKPVLISMSVIYFFLFITVNRYALIVGHFGELKYNPIDFNAGNLIAEQTRGMLDDITIIKYYETNDSPSYDYGITFTYFMIRAIPRSIIGDLKDSFYPPPAFPIIDKAYNLPPEWAATGEAPLHYAYFMVAGNIWFLFIGAFVVGLILGLVQRTINIDNRRDQVFATIICLALFMWYTRGYFPQFVDNLVFLLIPYYFYYGLIRKYAS